MHGWGRRLDGWMAGWHSAPCRVCAALTCSTAALPACRYGDATSGMVSLAVPA